MKKVPSLKQESKRKKKNFKPKGRSFYFPYEFGEPFGVKFEGPFRPLIVMQIP